MTSAINIDKLEPVSWEEAYALFPGISWNGSARMPDLFISENNVLILVSAWSGTYYWDNGWRWIEPAKPW